MTFELDEAANEANQWVTLGRRDAEQKTIEPFNLSEMSYLSFWVKMEAFSGTQTVNFFVEIEEDTHSDGRYVFGQDAAGRAAAGRFTGDPEEKNWRRVLIPLSQFRQVEHWDRILEISFVVRVKRGAVSGKLLIDRLGAGLNYPEGVNGKEIRMQNRVSSFKIGGRVAGSGMSLKRGPTFLVLTMTFIDPYLEEIRFEESRDEGRNWKALKSFYDHRQGGVYKVHWKPDKGLRSGQIVSFRVVGVSVVGGEHELAEPYHVNFN